MATVVSFLLLISGSCYHYFGGIIPQKACNIATVKPKLFLSNASWYQHSGISIPFEANIIATVSPYSSYSSGL